MIAEYLTRRGAEDYARELARHYDPNVRFNVVGMRDPVTGGTVWHVLGIGTLAGRIFAQYAQERKEWRLASAGVEKPALPARGNAGDQQ